MTGDRRCLVVDGHALLRRGVRDVLRDGYDVEEAADLREALDAATDTGGFDVVVVEMEPGTRADGEPRGATLIRTLRKAMPGSGIVAHGRQPARAPAAEALRAGATAFVAKSSPVERLRDAVDAAADANRFVDPATPAKGTRGGMLTRRQREILQLLADGHSTTAAAHQLRLSAETVRTHTKAALSRLEARDRAHAVAIALRAGLIE